MAGEDVESADMPKRWSTSESHLVSEVDYIVMGKMCHGGKSELVFIERAHNSECYRDGIFNEHVRHLASAIGNDFVKVDDKAPPH